MGSVQGLVCARLDPHIPGPQRAGQWYGCGLTAFDPGSRLVVERAMRITQPQSSAGEFDGCKQGGNGDGPASSIRFGDRPGTGRSPSPGARRKRLAGLWVRSARRRAEHAQIAKPLADARERCHPQHAPQRPGGRAKAGVVAPGSMPRGSYRRLAGIDLPGMDIDHQRKVPELLIAYGRHRKPGRKEPQI